MRTYEQANTQTSSTSTGHQREVDAMGNSDGKHNPVHLRFSHGVCLHPWIVGKGSGQCRDIQNDFTRFFYSYRRHDWIPEWYQVDAK